MRQMANVVMVQRICRVTEHHAGWPGRDEAASQPVRDGAAHVLPDQRDSSLRQLVDPLLPDRVVLEYE